jgi:hypothetical protein
VGDWQERVERIRLGAQEAAGEVSLAQAMEEIEAFVHQSLPYYDAFLLKARLCVRKAFVGTLTK